MLFLNHQMSLLMFRFEYYIQFECLYTSCKQIHVYMFYHVFSRSGMRIQSWHAIKGWHVCGKCWRKVKQTDEREEQRATGRATFPGCAKGCWYAPGWAAPRGQSSRRTWQAPLCALSSRNSGSCGPAKTNCPLGGLVKKETEKMRESMKRWTVMLDPF